MMGGMMGGMIGGMTDDAAELFVGISELVQPYENEGTSREPLVVIRDAALLVGRDGRVIAAGARATVEQEATARAAAQAAAPARRTDLGGRAVIPGLVDSHTHVLFAGERIDEMARRARGESYEEILAAGGGIHASMHALREASDEELVAASAARLRGMLERGTTTCEIKSGYGLTPQLELKQLRAIETLRASVPTQVIATVLAHVIPMAQRADRSGYVTSFCRDVVQPAARAGLARYADVFVEAGAFTPDEARRIAHAARDAGLGIKLHVDQARDGDGARLAADLGALSADHLEHISDAGRRALAECGVIATILPGCGLFLGKGPWPDGAALRAAGCEVAVATDCNPGSSMVSDLLLCATLASTRCGLTCEEALWGATRGGAKALGLNDRGRLTVGERADFVVIDHRDWRAALYQPGAPPVACVVVGGTRVYTCRDDRMSGRGPA